MVDESLLIAACTREMKESEGHVFSATLTIPAARHPANDLGKHPGAAEFAKALSAWLCEAGPNLATLVILGWDPTYDGSWGPPDDEAEEPTREPFIVLPSGGMEA